MVVGVRQRGGCMSINSVSRHVTDGDLALLDVMVAQILGFRRCLAEGLQPDSPSSMG